MLQVQLQYNLATGFFSAQYGKILRGDFNIGRYRSSNPILKSSCGLLGTSLGYSLLLLYLAQHSYISINFQHNLQKHTTKSFLPHLYTSYTPMVQTIIDNSPYRLFFYLDKSRQKKQISEKNLSKVVKSQNLVEKCCNARKI